MLRMERSDGLLSATS